jgi:hypothetical protein
MTTNDAIFEYLLEMGAMAPEQEELRRRQEMVNALRAQSLTPMQGQMVGKHYVAPGIANALAQLGTGYLASQQQKEVQGATAALNAEQRRRLEELRRRRRMGLGGGMMDAPYGSPYSNLPTYGDMA